MGKHIYPLCLHSELYVYVFTHSNASQDVEVCCPISQAAEVYAYTQPQVLSRLNVLRALKESMSQMPVPPALFLGQSTGWLLGYSNNTYSKDS